MQPGGRELSEDELAAAVAGGQAPLLPKEEVMIGIGVGLAVGAAASAAAAAWPTHRAGAAVGGGGRTEAAAWRKRAATAARPRSRPATQDVST